jgi:hypothetical protein
MRVIMRMLATTNGESVICTPIDDSFEPSGPMLNGTTYIVRPGHKQQQRLKSHVAFGTRKTKNKKQKTTLGSTRGTFHAAVEQAGHFGAHLGGRRPIVERTGVALLAAADVGARLYARHIAHITARIVRIRSLLRIQRYHRACKRVAITSHATTARPIEPLAYPIVPCHPSNACSRLHCLSNIEQPIKPIHNETAKKIKIKTENGLCQRSQPK